MSVFTFQKFQSSVYDIRENFSELYDTWIAADRPDDAMLELTGVSFRANDRSIFGTPNMDYIAREIAWYDSQSLRVDGIPGGAPKIWLQVADSDGYVNSNYGFLLYHDGNYAQFEEVVATLIKDQATRQAIAIYTRPSIHNDWDYAGGHDFICTNTVQYLIRDGELITVVNMRSNDAVFGYRNDFAWQSVVQARVQTQLKLNGIDVKLGPIIWQVGSLHVYPRHFHLVEHYAKTGEHDVPVSKVAEKKS